MPHKPADLRAVLDDADVTLGDCIIAFAADENNPYVVLARQQHKPGVLELGEPTHVNEMPDGAYVMAWIWIPKPEQIDGDSCAMPLDSAQDTSSTCPGCDRQGTDTCQHADDARTCEATQ
jgi:hypothetical protein